MHGDSVVSLLLHEGKVFEDQVVFLAGHSYKNCTFRRCTLSIKSHFFLVDGCTFEGCVWDLDLVFSDPEVWAKFLRDMAPIITATLPARPDGPHTV